MCIQAAPPIDAHLLFTIYQPKLLRKQKTEIDLANIFSGAPVIYGPFADQELPAEGSL